MYSPEQTAQMLGISKPTLRKYARLYSGHLSDSANRAQRKYTEGDIAILAKIVQLRAEGISLKDIPDHLGIVEPLTPDKSLALIPTIAAEFENISARFSAHDQRLEALQKEIEQLKAEQKRSWLQRLFGKK